ncbi:flavodoxin domain-containing protein [Streptomyces zingiberis]|uniref:Flavodoxin n=1 Tax=Streptomyces zingiberis TaxID=2053010 RepID=A0ABX1BQZ7_9ACTN|nr:flavodoxin domain-containing protein [Streptomyces zingiberis]NJQ00156.1 flavodoxin [Streptomyces zingiberis]
MAGSEAGDGVPVLVAYASAHGSTREIAERIAERLARAGHRVETYEVDGTVPPDPGRYHAVIIGSPVHDMRWVPEAAAYVHRHQAALERRRVWLFSVGMSEALGRPFHARAVRHEPRDLPGLREVVHPEETRQFPGALRRRHLTPLGRVIFRAMGGRYGDHRDWDRVDAWAEAIVRGLPRAERRRPPV